MFNAYTYFQARNQGAGGRSGRTTRRPPVCRQKVRFRGWKKVFDEYAIKLKFRFVSLSLYCQMKSQTQQESRFEQKVRPN